MIETGHRTALLVALALMAAACRPGDEPAPIANEGTGASAVNETAVANAAAPDPGPQAWGPEDTKVILRGDGVLVELPGHGIPLVFDKTTMAEAEEALASLGPPQRASNDECPAGKLDFMDWKNGLGLTFQDGKFIGWSVDESGQSTLATNDGLFVSATRADVMANGTKAEIFESTLGTEFSVGEIGGMLDGPGSAANVTDLWAGTNCMFR